MNIYMSKRKYHSILGILIIVFNSISLVRGLGTEAMSKMALKLLEFKACLSVCCPV